MLSDLWVVTSLFNPAQYKSRPANYNIFKKSLLEQEVNLLTVEGIFHGQKPMLESDSNVIYIQIDDILWQKERLLNIGIERLPDSCKKVIFADCDIIWKNPHWAYETSALLDKYAIVQPFQTFKNVVMENGEALYIHNSEYDGRSYGYVHTIDKEAHRYGYQKHGHTGFAWGAKKDLLEKYKIYDGCIGGSGDLIFAHALTGDFDHPTVYQAGPGSQPIYHHARAWMQEFYEHVRGSISYTTGMMLHIWHGYRQDRQYLRRHRQFVELGFNPYLDIRIGKSGAWEWATDKPELHKWSADYFHQRREDVLADPRALKLDYNSFS